MRLTSYCERLNSTLYFQGPIHPDCSLEILSYPISSGSLYPEDIAQFFRSGQNFDWSLDCTSPWNTGKCYLKFGIKTARYLTLWCICQAAQRVNSHPTFPSSAVAPNSYLTSYSRLLLRWSCLALPYSKPLAQMCLPLPTVDDRESSENIFFCGPRRFLSVLPVP